MLTLAERVNRRLQIIGMKPAELARRSGVAGPSVAKWRNGGTKEISGTRLLKAAAALQCNPAWLGDGHGPETTVVKGDQAPYPAHKGSTVLSTSTAVLISAPASTRLLIDQLGESVDHCELETRAAVASLLSQYALNPKPGAIADALVMFLDRCVTPNANNPWKGAAPGQPPPSVKTKRTTGTPVP